MVDVKVVVPLSPPNSPRMSEAAAKTSEYRWQQPSVAAFNASPYIHTRPQHAPTTEQAEDAAQPPEDATRPPLRSHKSFPYSLGPSSRLQHEANLSQSGVPTLADFKEQVVSQGPQPIGSASLLPATYGGSAPNSPTGRLTPNSPPGGSGEAQGEDEEIDFGTADQEDDEEKPPMTAAELRAHKRKMKRFRRAKLKRLTTDDRERMMRSRALPADFDMTQALHAPFGATTAQPGVGTPMPSPNGFASLGQTSGLRPLTLDTLRRVPDYEPYAQQQYASPTGISPALGAFGFTPPQSASDTISPTSAASSYTFQTQGSPRRHPFGLPMGPQAGYSAHHPQMPRPFLHERLSRPSGEPAGSPLRTSMSYTGFGSSSMPPLHSQDKASSFSGQSPLLQERPQQHRSLTGPTGPASGPYGLGFTYGSLGSSYASAEQQQQPIASNEDTQQPMVMQEYRRSSSHLAGPPIGSYAPYQPPHFATPHIPPYPTFGQYPSQAFHSPFQQQSQQQPQARHTTHQSFASIPSQTQGFTPLPGSGEHEAEQGDNSDGGVSLPATY